MLILVRHGRTALNAEGRLQGRLDEPLDDVGLAQAAATAARVGPVDVVISSPLLRARQTAQAWGQPFSVDERWTELAYGIYEGKKLTELGTTSGGAAGDTEVAWDRWRSDSSFVPEGGESLDVVDARVRAACDDVIALAREQRVVVVSHVSPIKSAVAWTLGAGVEIAWRSYLSPASICRIEIRNDTPVLTAFNETP